jgi:hypothetical protein
MVNIYNIIFIFQYDFSLTRKHELLFLVLERDQQADYL